MTVEELVRKYLMQKTGVRHNTEANYNFVLNIIKKEEFGKRRIDKVKQSDAKCWLISCSRMAGVTAPSILSGVLSDLPFRWPLMMI